jgi:hypothetical protein
MAIHQVFEPHRLVSGSHAGNFGFMSFKQQKKSSLIHLGLDRQNLGHLGLAIYNLATTSIRQELQTSLQITSKRQT